MSIFTIDPEKKAERLRRRAARKEARAAAAQAKADAFDPPDEDGETATIEAVDAQGRRRKQQIQLRKKGSKVRNQRIKTLELQVAELTSQVENQAEDLEELREALRKKEGNVQLLSEGMLGAANALMGVLNIGDRPQSPGALFLAEAMAGLSHSNQLDEGTQKWALLAATVSKAIAYYDPDQGLGSVLARDDRGRQVPPNTQRIPRQRHDEGNLDGTRRPDTLPTQPVVGPVGV